ncbi:hypothetical protein SDC9_168359 [bioreactor metagenome]|uniref:Uncharacterized protein n=1 Tax=bioreactor metagenome TaxID=1076179 RepID=A0A645G4Y7_9ZZZZ
MAAKLRIRHIGSGQPRDGVAGSAFGNQVDGAPYRSSRGHAIEQCGRSFEHFDALEHLWRGAVVGSHAIETAQRHVGAAGREAANRVILAP